MFESGSPSPIMVDETATGVVNLTVGLITGNLCGEVKIDFQVSLLNATGIILYSGKFSHGPKICGFADRLAATKIRTTKFFSAKYGLLVGVVLPER